MESHPVNKKKNTSIINDKPYVGAGRGIGNLDISEMIRTGQDTRRYNDQYREKQESHVIDLMFAPYRPFQDQSLFVNLLSVLYDGFLGFFSPSPFLLFYILLNGFSITVLLMLPVKIFFLISFLRSLISIFSSHKKNVASIIRPLFYTIFLTLLIFSISEAHYGTLFRYTFPFQVIFIFIFLRRCRGNAL